MSRFRVYLDGRRIAMMGAIVALLAAAIAGGYLLGTASGSEDPTGSPAERDAARVAFTAADAVALSEGLEQGRRAGAVIGEKQGRLAGRVRGGSAGGAAAHDQFQTLASRRPQTAGSGGEAEAEVGAGLGSKGPLDNTGEVLVVGDSLQELSAPYLQQYLPKVPLTINAVGGYNSYQIFDLFQESYDPSQSVIVFDAGTNDNPNYPEILAGNLQAVAKIVGDRCMVVPTIHGLLVDGVNSAAKNRVVAQFAASRPGTQTPDWAGAVASHPELMQPDNLHPIAEGADLRAQLIAEGVRACLEGDLGF